MPNKKLCGFRMELSATEATWQPSDSIDRLATVRLPMYTPCQTVAAAHRLPQDELDAIYRSNPEFGLFKRRQHIARLAKLAAMHPGFCSASDEAESDLHPCLPQPRPSSQHVLKEDCCEATARGTGPVTSMGSATGLPVPARQDSPKRACSLQTRPCSRTICAVPATSPTGADRRRQSLQPAAPLRDLLLTGSGALAFLSFQSSSPGNHAGHLTEGARSYDPTRPPSRKDSDTWSSYAAADQDTVGSPTTDSATDCRRSSPNPPASLAMTPAVTPRSPVVKILQIKPEKREVTQDQVHAYAMKLSANPKTLDKAPNPDILEVLMRRRDHFLRRALHYLGVPYGPGAKARPGQQIGEGAKTNPGIYLDCCALIRRILEDMAETLEIAVGPYNQSFLFDTLPIAICQKQLCPGDLIFVQGKFYDTERKQPKHDIVHVEIYLGGASGESSLGARHRDGCVDVFDSFKYESQSYLIEKYHFRSIDTWLGGVHKSWCKEHRWLTGNWKPKHGSKFVSVPALLKEASPRVGQSVPKAKVEPVLPARNLNVMRSNISCRRVSSYARPSRSPSCKRDMDGATDIPSCSPERRCSDDNMPQGWAETSIYFPMVSPSENGE